MATTKTGGKTLGNLAERAAKSNQVLVRLKPYNPKKGYVLMKYTAFGVLFEENKGWYLVDPHVAAYLRTIKARPEDPEHALDAFDVCTPEEAAKLANAENEAAIRQGRAAPNAPNKVVGRDVRTGTDMGPKPENLPPPGFDNPPAPKVETTPPPRSMRAPGARGPRDDR
jgi:hypothetical protein